ncbi:MAG: hypothetical protein JOZ69_16695 [Myxococcales bacterium]|nr:hypothetical protein [Myxococcales bacterium]
MHLLPSVRPLLVSALVGLACLGPSGAARAAGVSPLEATPDQRKQATEHFVAGRRAIDTRELPAAIAEFMASIEVVDSPNAHLELARALRDAARFDEAWAEYGVARAIGTALAVREARYGKTAEAAASERTEVEKRLGFVAVNVVHARAGAVLKVGARTIPPAEWGAPVAVLPGAVDVVLEDPKGAELASSRSIVTLGAVASISLDAQPPAATPEPWSAAAVADATDEQQPTPRPRLPSDVAPVTTPSGSKLRPIGYVAGGVGVLGFAAFGVFGLMSNATYADLKSACPHGCPTDHQAEIDAGRTQQIVANVGLGVGVAGLAVGTTLLLLGSRSPSRPASATLLVGPGYLGVRGAL